MTPMRGSSAHPGSRSGGGCEQRAALLVVPRPVDRHDKRAKRASPASAGVEGGAAGIERASTRCLAADGGRRSLPPVRTGGRTAAHLNPWRNCRVPQPAAERPHANLDRRQNPWASPPAARRQMRLGAWPKGAQANAERLVFHLMFPRGTSRTRVLARPSRPRLPSAGMSCFTVMFPRGTCPRLSTGSAHRLRSAYSAAPRTAVDGQWIDMVPQRWRSPRSPGRA